MEIKALIMKCILNLLLLLLFSSPVNVVVKGFILAGKDIRGEIKPKGLLTHWT